MTRLTLGIIGSLCIIALHADMAFCIGVRPGDEMDREIEKYQSHNFGNYPAEAIVRMVGKPEHEHILQLAMKPTGKDNEVDDLLDLSLVPDAMIYGVRWNDNPPFVLKETKMEECKGQYIALPYKSICWYKVFVDGEKRSKGEKKSRLMGLFFNKVKKSPEYFDKSTNAVILLRSHFGDMQFLHSMASKPKETAAETQAKIMMWAELMWRTATGELARGQDLTTTGIVGLDKLFRQGDTLQTILIPNRPNLQSQIHLVALGSLLHVVHDSFTKSHTERELSNGSSSGEGLPDAPGNAVRFLNYSLQNSSAHSEQDTRQAVNLQIVTELPNMVSVSRSLIRLHSEGKKWEEVRPYFSAIFAVKDPTTETSSGGFE